MVAEKLGGEILEQSDLFLLKGGSVSATLFPLLLDLERVDEGSCVEIRLLIFILESGRKVGVGGMAAVVRIVEPDGLN